MNVLISLTVFINLYSQIFYKLHKLFPYESPESKFDLAIKNVKVNPRSSLEHFGEKSLKLSMKSYVLKFPHVWSCRKISQGHYLNYLGITLVPNATYYVSMLSVDCVTWPLVLTNLHVLIKTIFKAKSSKLSIKSYVLAFSHGWLWRKIGQGQHKVIIWTILVVLKLHTKLQDWFWGWRFLKDFTIYGFGGHIAHLNIFSFPQLQVALNGIWLQLAQWLLSGCLKLS